MDFRQNVESFQSIASCPDAKTAEHYLRESGGNLEHALNSYFSRERELFDSDGSASMDTDSQRNSGSDSSRSGTRRQRADFGDEEEVRAPMEYKTSRLVDFSDDDDEDFLIRRNHELLQDHFAMVHRHRQNPAPTASDRLPNEMGSTYVRSASKKSTTSTNGTTTTSRPSSWNASDLSVVGTSALRRNTNPERLRREPGISGRLYNYSGENDDDNASDEEPQDSLPRPSAISKPSTIDELYRVPAFFRANFEQAMEEATAQDLALLLVLHSRKESFVADCMKQTHDIWRDENILGYLEQNTIPVQIFDDSPEFQVLLNRYRFQLRFPQVLILHPVTASRVDTLYGVSTVERVFEFLIRVAEKLSTCAAARAPTPQPITEYDYDYDFDDSVEADSVKGERNPPPHRQSASSDNGNRGLSLLDAERNALLSMGSEEEILARVAAQSYEEAERKYHGIPSDTSDSQSGRSSTTTTTNTKTDSHTRTADPDPELPFIRNDFESAVPRIPAAGSQNPGYLNRHGEFGVNARQAMLNNTQNADGFAADNRGHLRSRDSDSDEDLHSDPESHFVPEHDDVNDSVADDDEDISHPTRDPTWEDVDAVVKMRQENIDYFTSKGPASETLRVRLRLPAGSETLSLRKDAPVSVLFDKAYLNYVQSQRNQKSPAELMPTTVNVRIVVPVSNQELECSQATVQDIGLANVSLSVHYD